MKYLCPEAPGAHPLLMTRGISVHQASEHKRTNERCTRASAPRGYTLHRFAEARDTCIRPVDRRAETTIRESDHYPEFSFAQHSRVLSRAAHKYPRLLYNTSYLYTHFIIYPLPVTRAREPSFHECAFSGEKTRG